MNRWKVFLERSVASASLAGIFCLGAAGCQAPVGDVKADPPPIVEHTESALTVNSWAYKGGNGVQMPGSSVVWSDVVADIDYATAAATYRLGTGYGGAFQYTPQGNFGQAIADTIPTTSGLNNQIGAIATSPTDGNTFLVGTGSIATLGQAAGSGLWQTTNGGGTWNHAMTGPTTGAIVYRISWSTHTPGKVWVAATNGLFVSTNSGASFSTVIWQHRVTDIVHSADDSKVVIASDTDGGVLLSTQGGTINTFNPVTGFPQGLSSVIRLSMDSSGNNVFAQWGTSTNGAMQMAKSTNGGANWGTIAAPVNQNDGGCNLGRTQALAVSPDGQTVVTACNFLYRSTNGGGNWTPITLVDGTTGFHFLKFVSASTIVMGAETGWHYSNDAGLTWNSNTNSVPIMTLWDFDARIDSPTVYFGAASNINVFNSVDSGASWHGNTSPYGIGNITVDPAAGSQRAWASHGEGLCYTTTNQGGTWTQNTSLSGCYDPQHDQVPGVYLYAHGLLAGSKTTYNIYRSTDGGVTYSVYPSGVPSLPAMVISHATGRYSSSIPGSVVYTVVSAPTKFLAMDPSYSYTTWRDFTSQLMTPATPDWWMMRFATSLTSYNVAFAFTDNMIWRTANSGANWTFVSSTTPIPSGTTINDVLEDPLNTNIWIAATSTGFYKTSDGGANWRRWANGLPAGPGVKLRGQISGSTFQVFGGTNFRGIWQRDAAGDDS